MAEQGKGYRQRLGQRGEDLAAEYLEERDYKMIDRNVRRREGEIDLVATHKKTLVIVELKLRSSAQFDLAADGEVGDVQHVESGIEG